MGGGSTQVSFELQAGEKDRGHRGPVGPGWCLVPVVPWLVPQWPLSETAVEFTVTPQDRIPATDFYQFQTALGKAAQRVVQHFSQFQGTWGVFR